MEVKISKNIEGKALQLFRIDWGSKAVKGSSLYNHISKPFANCQTLVIDNAYDIATHLDKDELKDWLKAITEESGKNQLVIDIRAEYLSRVRKNITPFKKKFQSMKYTSTNDSKMVLCIVQLDPTKLK